MREGLLKLTNGRRKDCLHSPPRIPPTIVPCAWPRAESRSAKLQNGPKLQNAWHKDKQISKPPHLLSGKDARSIYLHWYFALLQIQYHDGIRGRRKWRRRREAQVFSPGKAKEETKTPLKTGGTETPIHERSHPLLPVLCPDIHRRYYQLCTVFLSTGSHGFGSW